MDINWSTACLDWAERIRAGKSIIPPPIFPEEAERALAIFKELRIVDAPGSPTFGEACAPWVFELVSSIFGAYDPVSGKRLITEWFICVPKKNSKSSISAAIMMTALILNWRNSAEFTILAPTIEVASNAFTPSRDMVQYDSELSEMLHVQTHIKSITHREKQATLKVVAADSSTVGGKKSVGTLVDELHLFGKKKDAENMLREAIGGLASRPEGFVIYLTTQSDEPPAGIFKQKLDYARDVRDGKIHDPHFVPIIYEHPDDMVLNGEALLLENMAMVNPNMGYSVNYAFLEREYHKAKHTGEESFRGFMAKHANVEIGLNLRSDRWAGADFWEASCQSVTLDDILEKSEVVTIGIDGGGLDDLLGLYVMGREKVTGNKLGWAYAWAHPSVLDRRKEIAPRLQDFERCGEMGIVRRIGDDIVELADICERIKKAGLLDTIGVDPMALGAIEEGLNDKGIDSDTYIRAVSQGWKLCGAIKTCERWLAEGSFIPAKQGLMAWAVGNAKIEARANGIMITKQASGFAKIDPVMAMMNAVSLMALNPVAKKKKYQMYFL